MREIKFRVWDPTNAMMLCSINSLNFNGNEGYDNLCITLRRTKPEIPDYEKCLVMQYTGLKDKNGIEIYEGDFYIHDNCLMVHVVKDIVSFLEMLSDGKGTDSQELCISTGIEVIGNVHENPELLS
jgi:uncharacterized phage protein (TIGR01671 family)